MLKINTLTRKELYDLVWSKPVSTLSKEFDISALELRKICTEYNIPLPINGHWSKLKFSKPIKIIPFNENFEDPKLIQYLPKIIKSKKIENENNPRRTNIPVKLINPLPEILEAFEKLKKFKFTEWNNMTYSSEVLSVRVSNLKLLNRALRIMDVFLKSLVERGFTYEIILGDLNIRKYGIVEKINCRELNNRKFFKDKYGRNSSSLCPNGRLSINVEGLRAKQWKDGKIKIEENIDIIVLQLDEYFLKEKLFKNQIESYWRDVKRLENERLLRENVIQNDIDKFINLKKNAQRFSECQMIRNYINAASKNQTDEWIQWANDAVDWYDPIISKPHEKLDYAEKNTLILNKKVN